MTKKLLGYFAASVAVALLLFAMVPPQQANANPSNGFEPGNIISDELFYDGTGWSASQVQSFLDQRVPRCTVGDPGRQAGTPIYGSHVASSCLKSFRMSTSSRTANTYCGAYTGAVNETAAQIISKVAQACGISPKVLLVVLEKEQSLVSDSWPTVRQFDFAMGYACPDSGPNNSANCDPTQTGFQQQVYRAAWQFKVYRAWPGNYNYRPFRSNNIQWHPNSGCGTSSVYLANWATAALYIYTPYRPNQAALNAGWGLGDACSSYGNRNFYNFYNAWFGNPRGFEVDARFQSLYNETGGATGLVGLPTGPALRVGIGETQDFVDATLFWNPYVGIGMIRGAIRSHFNQVGGVFGLLGYPVGQEVSIASGALQRFEFGEIRWSSATGAASIRGGILGRYSVEGTPALLGYPLQGEVSVPGGAKQEFEHGAIYWGARTSARMVRGGMLAAYHQEGIRDLIGLPVAEEVAIPGGAKQDFERGTIYWSPLTQAQVVRDGMLATYLRPGQSELLGLPVQVEGPIPGGAKQMFERGAVYWNARTGGQIVRDGMSNGYRMLGETSGVLGFPLASEAAVSGGAVQEFEFGSVFWSSSYGPQPVYGGIRATYLVNGAQTGPLGFPTQAERATSEGASQEFENGRVDWTRSGGGAVVLNRPNAER